MEPTYEQQIEYLAQWAFRFRCQFIIDGSVGFGRECVGMIRGNNFLDYSHIYEGAYKNVEFYHPPNAYHKHDCMAVLGHGPEAVRELYDWAKWLDDNGWTTDDVMTNYDNLLEIAMKGLTLPRLVKKELE